MTHRRFPLILLIELRGLLDTIYSKNKRLIRGTIIARKEKHLGTQLILII